MNCQNCGARLSCGCQKRVSSDKKEVCSSCITNHENNLIKLKIVTEEQHKVATLQNSK